MIILGNSADASANIAGASIYQESTTKFDVWPYTSAAASYDEQNELWYYIK